MMKKHDTVILVLTSLVCVATVFFLSLRDSNNADQISSKKEFGHLPPPSGEFVEEDESTIKILFLGSFNAGDSLAIDEKKGTPTATATDLDAFNDLTGLIESSDFVLIGLSAPLIFDKEGLTQTMNAPKKAGVQYTNAGLGAEAAEAPYRFEAKVGGLPFHVAVFAPLKRAARIPSSRANSEEAERRPILQPLQVKDLVARIDELKKAEPDLFVIVAPNWGRRFRWVDRGQQDNARKLIDAGADMIIGHGSNMVQEIERYKDRWILYGIGDIGQSSPNEHKETRKAVPYSFAVRLEVREKEDALHKTLRLYPIISNADRNKPGSRFLSAKEMGDFYWAMLEKTTRIDHWLKRSFIMRMDRYGHHLEILADGAMGESE